MSLRARSAPAPSAAEPAALRTALDTLRADLADYAFLLERRGRIDAADAVMDISARISLLCPPPHDNSRPLAPPPPLS